MPKTHPTASSLSSHSAGALFDAVVSWDNALDAYAKTQKGPPRHKPDAILFSRDWACNLRQLISEIRAKTYQVSPYHEFMVFDPKQRVVIAPSYRDKIVQHMINNALREIYEPAFISGSYACIRGRGNQAAVLALQSMMRKARRNYGAGAYLAKADIEKFFYSIDRDILKQVVRKKITCPDALWLVDTVINSAPTAKGLPLGNLSSQLFANVYLNEIDQRMKRKYGIRHYLRYADDAFMVLPDKVSARQALNDFTHEAQRLALAVGEKKAYVKPLRAGIDGLGFKVHATHIRLKGCHKIRFRRRVRCNTPAANMNSWFGFSRIAKCQSFIRNGLVGSRLKFNGQRFSEVHRDQI